MKNRLIKLTLVTSVLSTLMFSCNKKEAQLGALVSAPTDNFKITKEFTLSTDSVDFSTEAIKAELEFNEKVDFDVIVTGMKSGAKRTLKFTSDKLSISDELWNGNHEGLIYFRDNENVEIKVDFVGESQPSLTKQVYVKKRRDFIASNPSKIVASEYFDFEEIPGRKVPWGFLQFKWKYFSGYAYDVPEPEKTPEKLLIREVSRNEVPVYEGDSCLRFNVLGVDKLGYRGGCDIMYGYDDINSEIIKYPLASYSPDDVYLNFYLYGNSDPDVTLDVLVMEDDNEDGRHTANAEDRYLVTIPMDFSGWKKFSYKYSDMPRATNAEFGGNGNKVRETDKLTIVSVAYNSSTAGEKIVYIDNVFFTIGESFDPTNF